MEWNRYYSEENIRSLKEQSPYYAYILEQLAEYVSKGKAPDEPLFVALGGIHPKVTRPEHFIALCEDSLDHLIFPIILDQNEQALQGLSQDGYVAMQANLEDLPEITPPLSLLICDYTTDFMTDSQLSHMNQTLPGHLDPNGLLMLTVDTPTIPGLSRLRNKISFNVNVHPRSEKKLTTLLSNFKLVYVAQTENDNLLTVFASIDSPLEAHKGAPFSLSPEENGGFGKWLSQQKEKSAP